MASNRIDITKGIDADTSPDVAIFSYYRNAEQHGANLIFRLLKHLEDPDSQTALSQHLADETRHAWLWTERILRAGAKPMVVCDGYQTRMGKMAGMPRDIIELLALTVVVEQRALRRYQQHLRRPNLDPDTEEVLRAVSKDEGWHIDWIRTLGRKISEERGDPERYDRAVKKYREIDAAVVRHLEEAERRIFADAPPLVSDEAR